MANFNTTTRTGVIQIDNSQDILGVTIPNVPNNTFLYGNRLPLSVGQTSLPVPIPQPGFPSFSYYQPYKLPTNLLSDPNALLTYFSNCGYQVEYGYSDTTSLNNIGAYSPVPAANGQVYLYFANQSLNVQAIANTNVSGTFSITGTSITGSIVSITTGSYNQSIQANFAGNTTSASPNITNLTVNANLLIVGSTISGAGIPTGSTILTIVSATEITISQNATATATAVALSYTALTPLAADTLIIVNSSSYTGLQIGQTLVLNFVQASSNPDANNTEPFIMNLWQAASALQNMRAINTNLTVGAPSVYFSILPDAASTNYFQPTGNAMAMGVAPTTVAVSSPYVTISIPLTAAYASFVPLTTLGTTTISQATSLAVGTVFQSTINGNVLQVQLMNVTGTFNTTNNLTLTLDNTVTIMSLQQRSFNSQQLSLRTIPNIYEVNSNSDISSTYAALFNYVGGDTSGLNAPITAAVGQGNCSIIFGNQSIPQNLAVSQLPTNINSQYYNPVYYPYVQRPGVATQTVAQTMCAMATVFAANAYPFNPLSQLVLTNFANSPLPQDWISLAAGDTADQLLQLGWNVIATTSNSQQYLFQGQNGRTTINGIPDNQFYPSYVLDTKNYLRLGMRSIAISNGVGQVRQTSTTINSITAQTADLNTQMGLDGILTNVSANNSLIRVATDSTNPLAINMYNPVQQIPGFLNAYGTIVNYSVTLNLGNTI